MPFLGKMPLTPWRLVLMSALVLSVLSLLAATAWSRFALPARGGEAVVVRALPFVLDPAQPKRRHFGRLLWRGGLVLSSCVPYFGGLSGIALTEDGSQLFAVTDRGAWLSAKLAYDDKMRPQALQQVRMGPLLSRQGRKLRKKSRSDAEALDLLPVGEGGVRQALIAFERQHRIGVFPISGDSIGTPLRFLSLPPEIATLKKNKGLEAAAYLSEGPLAGSVLAFAERGLDAAGNMRGWLIGGSHPGALTLRRRAGFDVTGLVELPGGDVLVLERRFRITEGVKMRLRRVRATEIRPGAVLDGEILFTADNSLQIDNMEGLAVHVSPQGETVLTLVSDDNFQPLQHTLLMQFTLPGTPDPQ